MLRIRKKAMLFFACFTLCNLFSLSLNSCGQEDSELEQNTDNELNTEDEFNSTESTVPPIEKSSAEDKSTAE